MESEEELFDVVISGISGKFPLSEDLEEFKNNLLQQKNLVSDENCRSTWNTENIKVPSATGKISVVKKFDDVFFGINGRVAAMMDPMTRVTIERAYEAIMDAGINPKSLKDSKTAVYTASCISDSEAIGCDEKLIAKFWLLAHVRSLLANRISYVLNLQGPSWTVDSTWTGGVVCLNHAVNDIRKGRVESALVGVTNVLLFPDISQHWLGLGKLSPDGTCRPFEEAANGYGRSESVVFLYLQRANDAKRIYATVEHADALFCGNEANNLLKPKEEAFVNFLQKFYSDCKISTNEIAYLEADGSADKYLDELELNAVGKVFCENRNNCLPVGTVKSNVGHAEGAACFVSLAKALISLDSEIIPPNLNVVGQLNKNIKTLHTNEMQIVTSPTPFQNGKYVAVNTIGWSTYLGHVLLKQNPKAKKPVLGKSLQIPRLIMLSARHESGILDVIEKLESLPYDPEYFTMINDVFKESMPSHFYRGYTILGSTEKRLRFTLEVGISSKRPVWFVYSGMGSQWPGMGADLMNLPIFAKAMKELDAYLAPLGIDIVDVISNFDPTVMRDIINNFVAITAIQIGLTDILTALGIKPDGMFGHSLGENACAYADGCFTKYQTIMASYYRGKTSVQRNVRKGLMVAVGLGYNKIMNLPESVEIACHNSYDNSTISGPYEDVKTYIEELKRQNIFVRTVNSNNIAYHSKQVEPMAAYLLENIRKVVPNPKKRSSKWISTSVLEKDWNTPLAETSSAEYHVHNFLNTVYFAEACTHIPKDAIVVEISPHGLFQAILKRSLHESCFNIPLGKRETSNSLNFLLSSIGKLYVIGLQPNVNALYEPIEYPVSRGTPNLASLATWDHEREWELMMYKDQIKIKPLEISLRDRKWRFLAGYKINEKVFIPFPLLMVETLKGYDTNDPILIFENVDIQSFIEVTSKSFITISTQVQYGSGNFEIVNGETIAISGMLRYSQENIPENIEEEEEYDNYDDYISFSKDEIREIFKQYSMEFPNEMNDIDKIIFSNTGCRASIIWKNNLAYFINSLANIKIFYEFCTHNEGSLLPSSFLKLSINMEQYNAMEAGVVVNIKYNKYTNIIAGPGVELIDLKNTCKPVTIAENKLLIQNLEFVPNGNPHMQALENFVSLCGQIIGETFRVEMNHKREDSTSRIVIFRTNDFNNNKDFENEEQYLLDSLFRKLPEQAQNDVVFVNSEDFNNIGMHGNRRDQYLIISNSSESVVQKSANLAHYCVNDVFILTFNTSSTLSDVYVRIIEECFGKYDVTLWKKKVQVNSNVLEIDPYHKNNWLENLEENLYHIKSHKSIIVHWFSEFIVDIIDILNQISAIGTVHKIRYAITMDKNAKIDLENLAYEEELQKGSILNVYKNGKWGSIRYIAVTNNLSSLSNIQKFIVKSKKIEDIDVEYVTVDTSSNNSFELENNCLGFSGATADSRVMGIAHFESNGNPERFLSWPVPKQWSLEDAVTVPLAYIKAYYALIVKGKLLRESSLLIHSGYSVLGEAAIAISLSLDCDVYTSARSEEEAKHIRARFRDSSHLIVFNTEIHKVDVEILKLTNGKGVNIAINSDTEKQIQESIRCVHCFGSILHLSADCLRADAKIGMEMFIKNTAFHSLTNLTALKTRPDIKNELQKAFQMMVENGISRPFRRTVHNSENDFELRRMLKKHDKSQQIAIRQQSSTNEIFFSDPEKSYLIIANKTEIWFNISTRLIKHGAKRLVFIDDNPNVDEFNQYQKRFNVFCQNYLDISLVHVPADTVNDKEAASNMIRTINEFRTLDVAFCVSLNDHQIKNIDAGLQKYAPNLRQLVCLQCDFSRIYESRRRLSLPTLNVIWNKSISEPKILIKNINQIIDNLLRINSPLLFITETSRFTTKHGNSKLQEIGDFMLKYSEAEHFVNSFSTNVSFEKLVSKCSHYCKRTQLFPIFVIPGLYHERLRPLIRKLMYPVFSAKITPEYTSARNIAQLLLKPLKDIQPDGPYTIVGESWGGSIAIELTLLLEENYEDKVQLILLEGIPKDMQKKLSLIGVFKNQDFLDNLSESCSGKKVNERSEESKEKKSNNDEIKFLELLRNKLAITYYYKPTVVDIRNKVIAIKSTDDYVLDTYIEFEKHYGQEIDIQFLGTENYDRLIDSDIAAKIINDNVLFKW